MEARQISRRNGVRVHKFGALETPPGGCLLRPRSGTRTALLPSPPDVLQAIPSVQPLGVTGTLMTSRTRTPDDARGSMLAEDNASYLILISCCVG